MIGKAIYDILSNNAEVTALVGTKIYPVVLPMGVDFPAVVYRVVDTDPTEVKQSLVQESYKVEVLVAEQTYDAAVNLGERIKTALNRVSGTFAGIKIQRCNYTSKSDGFDKDDNLFIRTTTFLITQNL